VVKGFGELLKSNLDLIVRERSVVVGIKLMEAFFGLFPGKAFSFVFLNSDSGGCGKEKKLTPLPQEKLTRKNSTNSPMPSSDTSDSATMLEKPDKLKEELNASPGDKP
jgi:hypothetical protein